MEPSSSFRGADSPDLAEVLRKDQYLRDRLQPSRALMEYLVHIDLRDVVEQLCRSLQGRALDYGCGGSPYARLLPQFSPYVRADITASEGIDLVLDVRGLLPGEAEGSYDVVLSTQVLEHVPDTDCYLNEAFRLLRPGGALVLTTHGFYPEHGCPNDYYRWTGYGLERAVEKAGFVVQESYKITAGLRAAIYLLHVTMLYYMKWPQGGLLDRVLRGIRGIYRRFLIAPLNYVGAGIRHQARVSGHSDADHLYAGVALLAQKPGSAR